MDHRWLPLLLSAALICLIGGCRAWRSGPGPGAEAQAPRPSSQASEAQRLAEARARAERQRLEERCLLERPELEERMAALRRAESRLAGVKDESYVPLPPPAPWDEAAESRFRQEDQETDWQRHLLERERWRQREAQRRASWWADHDARLGEAQAQLNQEAQALRNRRPDLFTGPGSIEFNPTVADQIRQCRRGESPIVGKTAPP
jgi:hypothetical protein